MPLKFTAFLILLLVIFAKGCEVDQMHNACRIINNQCNCGFGCKSEYRYLTQEQCKIALKGEENKCSSNPCNAGACLQISVPPKYKCSCQGTGFYGLNCEKNCHVPLDRRQRVFRPFECIVI
ncbi:uncharacterized protein LOC127290792 [Leptopilina boulardi]|uniref:uncharacterized protein LOC127290792 n=1 Tax=Leptopilina boulardi TaxID=63433 RepID=UPI0021F605D1|nr:uncharacterized protein LOC127290792 [Leptopilina boulardi]